jgi:hypothetical protein
MSSPSRPSRARRAAPRAMAGRGEAPRWRWGSRRIIVALDGSDASWDALWWGYREAKRLCGRVIAVFVSPGVDAKAGMVSAVGFDLGEYALAASQANAERAARLQAEVKCRATGDGDVDLVFNPCLQRSGTRVAADRRSSECRRDRRREIRQGSSPRRGIARAASPRQLPGADHRRRALMITGHEVRRSAWDPVGGRRLAHPGSADRSGPRAGSIVAITA